ncbi:glycine zipper 2TM domain-containing protein [Novosphingobium colocasiae]|uniref:17 kDa surface antigen n=1 Tax=Novosphingobium colocasiae TaxID=1256513 RepID=A0A918PGR3_9SPHN|nr:glycine zipper 2TM domain-containing protein [Novosphingobium colocasiae]GGZ05030.1 hypothetical protein GCM10011614_19840 [Novosphingobium colocasiae]
MRLSLILAGAAAMLATTAPALAHPGEEMAPPMPAPMSGPQQHYAPYDSAARDAWLADCRQRLSSRDNGVGGALIGGAVGALAGNRIAGRGNRTVGTIAGAAVGAVAGTVIDKAEDRGRNRDECEAYLDDYYARYTQPGYGYPGYGYGYPAGYGYGYAQGGCCMAQPMMMVPVMMVPVVQPKPECKETVEYVTEWVPARRHKRVYRPSKIVPDKRTKLVPMK